MSKLHEMIEIVGTEYNGLTTKGNFNSEKSLKPFAHQVSLSLNSLKLFSFCLL